LPFWESSAIFLIPARTVDRVLARVKQNRFYVTFTVKLRNFPEKAIGLGKGDYDI